MKRAILILAAGGALLLAWAWLQARSAVVTIHFVSPNPGTKLDVIYLTVGTEKLRAEAVQPGGIERFSFTPEPGEPLVIAFWLNGKNGGWDGPILLPRQRLDLTIDEEGHVSSTECFWPCES